MRTAAAGDHAAFPREGVLPRIRLVQVGSGREHLCCGLLVAVPLAAPHLAPRLRPLRPRVQARRRVRGDGRDVDVCESDILSWLGASLAKRIEVSASYRTVSGAPWPRGSGRWPAHPACPSGTAPPRRSACPCCRCTRSCTARLAKTRLSGSGRGGFGEGAALTYRCCRWRTSSSTPAGR